MAPYIKKIFKKLKVLQHYKKKASRKLHLMLHLVLNEKRSSVSDLLEFSLEKYQFPFFKFNFLLRWFEQKKCAVGCYIVVNQNIKSSSLGINADVSENTFPFERLSLKSLWA